MSEDPLLTPGRVLDGFELVAPLRAGGMGVLWRAVHRRLNRQVAIKFMRRALAGDERARARFLREGEAAARVRHPNVVEVFDLGVVGDGTPYLVMELLEGEDLRARLARVGALPVAVAVDFALPVCAAVATAHREGVVHRDLKPANIFLSRTLERVEVPKVLDFGVSLICGAEPLARPDDPLLGTPGYVSPEQVDGARPVGPRSDQYALGAVLYECVTGAPAFPPGPRHALLRRVVEGRFEAPRSRASGLPPALEAVILRAMALDPAGRFGSVEELGGALLDFAPEHVRPQYQGRFPSLDGARGEVLAPPPPPDEGSLAGAVILETEGEAPSDPGSGGAAAEAWHRERPS